MRAAITSATIANAFGSGKGRKATPSDFMPDFEPKQPQSDQEIAARLRALAASYQRAA